MIKRTKNYAKGGDEMPVDKETRDEAVETLIAAQNGLSQAIELAEKGKIDIIDHEDGLMRIECPVREGRSPIEKRIKVVSITKNMSTVTISL